MARRPLLSCLVLAVSLGAACNGSPPDGEARQAADPADRPAHQAPEPAAHGAVDAALALEGEGLRIFIASSGSARPVPFGTPTGDAMARLAAVLGAPLEQGESADCGGSYARWSDDLITWFAEGQFAGWSVRGTSRLTTASGIGLGSTRGDILDAYNADFTPSTLGEEFRAGGLAGLLDSPGAGGSLTHLWAGVTCQAR